jgi:uncharacterized protein YqcC (DUF446 family)
MLNNQLALSAADCKQRHLLLQELNGLEAELRLLNLWQSMPPSISALSSRAPFAIDTLTFVQWLQFIFIGKISHLLQFSLPLPVAMSVQPMASEYFKRVAVNSAPIIEIIGRIDLLINNKAS